MLISGFNTRSLELISTKPAIESAASLGFKHRVLKLDKQILLDAVDMIIEDNYICDTGYGWYEEGLSFINQALYEGHSRNVFNYYGKIALDKGKVEVKNNIFSRAYTGLIYLDQDFGDGSGIPEFSGNTFAQRYGGVIATPLCGKVRATTKAESEKALKELYPNAGEVVILSN